MRRWLRRCVVIAVAVIVAGCTECPIHRALFPKDSSQNGAPAPQVATGQRTCPVMGGRINPAVYTDHEGKRVYFCCPRCIDTFKKDPERYVAKVQAQGA